MILIVLLALVALYLYMICPRIINRPDISALENIHYAHRGLHDNRTSAPENSMEAFRLAVEAGYGIEMDIQLTKDNIPVVCFPYFFAFSLIWSIKFIFIIFFDCFVLKLIRQNYENISSLLRIKKNIMKVFQQRNINSFLQKVKFPFTKNVSLHL